MSRQAQHSRVIQEEIEQLHKEEKVLEKEIDEHLEKAENTTDNEAADQIERDLKGLKDKIKQTEEEAKVSQ